MDLSVHYTQLKPFLFAIAYNMTGQVQEAEDIVHDAFADVLTKQNDGVRNAKSFLTRIVMNKAIDRLNYLKKERERYPSLWLPEPYITQGQGNDQTDILPYAFLHLMEELNPLERAVFILRQAFDYSYEDISALCDTTPENCRQLLHRAKLKVKPTNGLDLAKPRNEANEKILKEFLNACLTNNAAALKELLKEDVVIYSDGGGKVVAARRILTGIERVRKFILGIARKTLGIWSEATIVQVNQTPGLLMPDENGIYMVLVPEFHDDKVVSIFIVRNPDKISLPKVVTK